MLRIRDVYPVSEFFHPGFRIRRKEFKYFNLKKWFLGSKKYDRACSPRIPDPDPYFIPIPDPGVKKAPDPGSTTLLFFLFLSSFFHLFIDSIVLKIVKILKIIKGIFAKFNEIFHYNLYFQDKRRSLQLSKTDCECIQFLIRHKQSHNVR